MSPGLPHESRDDMAPPTAAMSAEAARHGRQQSRWAAYAGLCVLACFLGSLLVARSVASSDAARSKLSFRSASVAITGSLRTAIQHEEDLVDAAALYIVEHPEVRVPSFHRWVALSRAFVRYPELDEIGFVKVVPRRSLDAFEARIASEGHESKEGVMPRGARPFYCLPVSGVTRRAAAASTELDYCAVVPALRGSLRSGESTFLPLTAFGTTALGISTPVYGSGGVPASVSARQATFLGWVGIVIVPSVLIRSALGGHPGMMLAFSYTRGGQSVTFGGGHHGASAQTVTLPVGSGWTARITGPVQNGSVTTNQSATTILLGGSLVGVLLGALLFVLGTGRTRALALVARQTRSLRHQALHDSLTGLANRALVLNRAERMLIEARRHNRTIAALFVDIDDFKQVNDRYGHDAGDLLLRLVAERLDQAVRGTDTVGRLGGDEFVILPEEDTSPAELSLVAQRLLDAFGDAPVALPSGDIHRLTISVGIANGRYSCAEDLLRDADRALYHAKASGKGRFVVHSGAAGVGDGRNSVHTAP
jgi:diguanylate cyclase (GGDEF)-like protein